MLDRHPARLCNKECVRTGQQQKEWSVDAKLLCLCAAMDQNKAAQCLNVTAAHSTSANRLQLAL
jgi:hypothetical protein